MRIFQIITLADLGGAQSVVLNLANSLCEEHEVFVISTPNGPMWDSFDERVRQIKVKHLKRSISLRDIFVLCKLIWLGICYRPDVVHLHSSKIGILGRLAFPKRKIVYTVHGFDSIRIAFRRFLPIEKFLQRRAYAIVGVSKYDEHHLRVEGITKNVATIYNGIAEGKNTLNTKLSLAMGEIEKKDERSFVVICIARFFPPKKVDLFFDVARSLPQVMFYWIGNQYEIENLPENVSCLGEISNAAMLNQCADLFMLPSDYEGLPISIIEALSYSKPVVASNVGGISEILDGKNGFAVENTVEAFKERILLYKESQHLYKDACHAARLSYEEKFTVVQMVENYYKIYNEIVNK
jgi:glycosyltransferase involved in cell wall biosynthesis